MMAHYELHNSSFHSEGDAVCPTIRKHAGCVNFLVKFCFRAELVNFTADTLQQPLPWVLTKPSCSNPQQQRSESILLFWHWLLLLLLLPPDILHESSDHPAASVTPAMSHTIQQLIPVGSAAAVTAAAAAVAAAAAAAAAVAAAAVAAAAVAAATSAALLEAVVSCRGER
jgi:hypothetical protein